MENAVYILQSTITKKYYCGQTDNIPFRFLRHNAGEVKSTKHGLPWLLLGFVLCDNRSEAMKLEKKIKARGIERWLNENKHKLVTGTSAWSVPPERD